MKSKINDKRSTQRKKLGENIRNSTASRRFFKVSFPVSSKNREVFFSKEIVKPELQLHGMIARFKFPPIENSLQNFLDKKHKFLD